MSGLQLEDERVVDEIVHTKCSDSDVAEHHIEAVLAPRVDAELTKQDLERARVHGLGVSEAQLVVGGEEAADHLLRQSLMFHPGARNNGLREQR